jgi:predicted Mrr-cat superfamily restriction endonuclease
MMSLPTLKDFPIEQRGWIVRPGTGDEFDPGFLDHDVIALGWTNVGDVRNFDSPGAVWESATWDAEDERAGQFAARQLFNFAAEVKIGDVILTPLHRGSAHGRGACTHAAIGLVTSHYRYLALGETGPGPHVRDIRWLCISMPLGELPPDLYDIATHRTMTLHLLKEPYAARRVLATASGWLDAWGKTVSAVDRYLANARVADDR